MSSELIFFMPVVPCVEEPNTHTFICPNCGEPHGSTIDHLSVGSKTGSWYCSNCHRGVCLSVCEGGKTVECSLGQDYLAKTLVLLRLDVSTHKPIHIVVQGQLFYKFDASVQDAREKALLVALDECNTSINPYFYNHHTCPCNYLQVPIKEGDNADPHGLFVHQETVLAPKGYVNCFNQIEDPANKDLSEIELWHKYFPSLR